MCLNQLFLWLKRMKIGVSLKKKLNFHGLNTKIRTSTIRIDSTEVKTNFCIFQLNLDVLYLVCYQHLEVLKDKIYIHFLG